jgi:hypothetical protein
MHLSKYYPDIRLEKLEKTTNKSDHMSGRSAEVLIWYFLNTSLQRCHYTELVSGEGREDDYEL